MTTQQIPQTTHTEHIQELRDSADEAQAARLEVMTEIARLTKALREMTFARDVAITLNNNMIDERDKAKAEIARNNIIMAEAAQKMDELRVERDAARADAERLAVVAQKYYDSGAPHGRMCGQSPCLCGRNELGHALAAHWRARAGYVHL